MKNLERHHPVVLGILGEVNCRHSATTELSVNAVRLRQGVAKSLNR